MFVVAAAAAAAAGCCSGREAGAHIYNTQHTDVYYWHLSRVLLCFTRALPLDTVVCARRGRRRDCGGGG